MRWGLIALATVVIGAPTVFYAAKGAPPRRATRTAVNAPRVNAPALDPTALRRKGITDRLSTCRGARTAKEKERCYTKERQKCDQESSEKTWCAQRALIGKLSGTTATCGSVKKLGEKRRCLRQLWGNDTEADRKVLGNVDRQEVCASLTAQNDRDYCLYEAARQLQRDDTDHRSLCDRIRDENIRAACQD